MTTNTDILIIGGGVIGVCAATYLSRQGRQVTLIEREEIAAGASYGNAGLIVPSHSIPLAAPGVMLQGLKWMLKPESPFYIKPRLDPALLGWLLRFQAACREKPMHRAIPLLRDLQRASAALYDELIHEARLDCSYEQSGVLMLYRSGHGFDEGLAEARLLESYGLELTPLDGPAVREMEPAVRPEIVGGLYSREDAKLDPARFVRGLARQMVERGVVLHTNTEVVGFETSGGRVVAVKSSQGDYRAEQVILAAGAWSPGVGRDLRLKLPMQPAKGYSLTVKPPQPCPGRPLILGEARVAVTPLDGALRFAGTLELTGFDLSVNQRRVGAIKRAAADYLHGTRELEVLESWRGLRPCSPDGLPYLGRSKRFDNLIVAAGHAMLGVSLGAISGRLVSQLAADQTPDIDLELLRVERFG